MTIREIKQRKKEELLKKTELTDPETCFDADGYFFYDNSKYSPSSPRYTKFKIEYFSGVTEERFYDVNWAKKAFNEYLEDDDLFEEFCERVYIGINHNLTIKTLPSGEEIIACEIEESGGEDSDFSSAETSVRDILEMYGFCF